MDTVGIIGLGYVGLPLAVEFGKKIKTIGYDIKKSRIDDLRRNNDLANQLSKKEIKKAKRLFFTDDFNKLSNCNYIIITLPTPVKKNKTPDLDNIKITCKKLSKLIKKKTFIIFESTLYPKACEQEFLPIFIKYSSLKYKKDFFIGYSPERINVGDKKRSLTSITKIVSGDTEYSKKKIFNLYKKIMNKNIYVAESLAVAEAAKVFENTQRDVNISLMNELSIICNKLNINTSDVLRAASTKWNFLNFYPGLVGGHCISVDPHYLSYCAKKINHKAILINTGRKINDSMVNFITKKIIDDLGKLKKKKIIVLGLAFKENCSDIRDSKIFDVIKKLKSFFIIEKHDPYVNSDEVQEMYNESILAFNDLSKNVDAIIINQKHDYYKNPLVLKKIKKLLKKKAYIYDLKGLLNSKKIKKDYKVFNL